MVIIIPAESTIINMSKRQWNTVAERDHHLLLNLIEMCMDVLDDDVSLSSDDDDSFDEMDVLFDLTMEYGRSILQQHYLPTDIDFTKPPLRIADLSDDVESMDDFRFGKDGLEELVALLRQPLAKELEFVKGSVDMVKVKNWYTVPYETGILMILYRLARPNRVREDMERKFSCRRSHCSAICGTFIDALYDIALPYLTNPGLFLPRFEMYSQKIEAKTTVAAAINVWGFLDGTLKKTCRLGLFKKAAYSEPKPVHGIKLQNVTTPDGYIAHFFGPIAGNRHDSYMLSVSNLLPQLRAIMPAGTTSSIYALYGDPAYPQSAYLMGGIAGAAPASQEAKWNTAMSSGRIAVESTFGEVDRQFQALDLKHGVQIFKLPIVKYYAVAVFFLNCRNSLYGSPTSKYFACEPMSLDEYINLVKWN
jgi:DDE superfamily endonuclease